MQDAAPEVTEVVVEGMTEPPGPQLLQIGRRPSDAAASGPPGSPPAGPAGDPGWVSLPAIGPPDGRPVAAEAGGIPIVVCSVRGTLYAYCDACAACGSSLAGGHAHRRAARLPGLRRRLRRAVGGPGAGRPGTSPGPAPAAHRQPGDPGRAAGGGLPLTGQRGSPVAGQQGLRRFLQPPADAGPVAPATGAPPATGPAGPGTPAASPRGAEEPGPAAGQAEETCELCAAPIGPDHGHLADLEHSTLNCACRACYLLFTEPGAGPRPVPRGAGALPARSRPPADRRRVGRARRAGRARLLPVQLAARAGLRLLPEPGRRHRMHARPGRLGAARPGSPAAVQPGGRCRGGAGEPGRGRRSSASWCRSTRATSWPGGCGCCGRASTAARRRGRASPSSSTRCGSRARDLAPGP